MVCAVSSRSPASMAPAAIVRSTSSPWPLTVALTRPPPAVPWTSASASSCCAETSWLCIAAAAWRSCCISSWPPGSTRPSDVPRRHRPLCALFVSCRARYPEPTASTPARHYGAAVGGRQRRVGRDVGFAALLWAVRTGEMPDGTFRRHAGHLTVVVACLGHDAEGDGHRGTPVAGDRRGPVGVSLAPGGGGPARDRQDAGV